MSDIDYRPGRPKPWIARWHEPDGKQRSKGFKLKGEARRHLTEIQRQLDARVYIPPEAGKLTLREYSVGWLASSTADISTRDANGLRWRKHILPVLGEIPIAGIRPSTVQQFLAGLQRAQVAPAYIRVIKASLSAALTAAVNDRLLASNPCASVKSPRVPQSRAVPWDADRVAAVRAALPAHYQATVDAAIGLGLRQGEVFGLRLEDIDWMHRVVHVRQQVRLLRGHDLVTSPPQGGKQRAVPLPESVSLRLAEHIRKHPSGNGLLFTSGRGLPVNKNSYNAGWRAALDAAGVPRDRANGFHVLRHTFASMALAGGVDVRALSEFLGHADPGFTLRVYSHMMPSAPDKMRAAIDSALQLPADQSEVS